MSAALPVFQLNLIGASSTFLRRGRIGGVRANHEQTYMSAFFSHESSPPPCPADLANIDKLGAALRYARNSVTHFQSPIQLGGPARNQALNLA